MSPAEELRPPTLAEFLRAARRRRGLSRDALAAAAAVSTSYVAQLESGEKKHPSSTALGALAGALDLSPTERQHGFNLAALPRTGTAAKPTAKVTEDMTDAIERLPCIAGYVDDHWNILAVNDQHRAVFRGLAESGNLARWFFASDDAKDVLLQWESEAADCVHLLRGLTAAQPDNRWLPALLDELAEYPEFARFWQDGKVALTRSSPYMHVRDPDTGERYTVNAQLFVPLTESHTAAHLYLGVRMPYAGPEIPEPRTPDRTPDREPAAALCPPTLGEFLRTARKAKGLSRDQLAMAADVSTSYITQLETGEKDRPSAAALRALAAPLEFGPTEVRHMCNLAHLPGPDDSGTRPLDAATLAEMRAAIDELPCLASYLDNRSNVLAVNPMSVAAMPGLAESGNFIRWLFTHPMAKHVLIEWPAEAATSVRFLRGLVGFEPDDPRNLDLLKELSEIPEFRQFWNSERVGFTRSERYMHLRHPETGAPYSVYTQTYSALGLESVHIHLGVPVPYRGPTPT